VLLVFTGVLHWRQRRVLPALSPWVQTGSAALTAEKTKTTTATYSKGVVSPFFLAAEKMMVTPGTRSCWSFPATPRLPYWFSTGETSAAHYHAPLPGDQRDFLHNTNFILRRCIASVGEMSKILDFRPSSQWCSSLGPQETGNLLCPSELRCCGSGGTARCDVYLPVKRWVQGQEHSVAKLVLPGGVPLPALLG